MLELIIKGVAKDEIIEASESLSRYLIKCDLDHSHPLCQEKIIKAVHLISDRDIFELTLEIDGTDELITQKDDIYKISSHIAENSDAELIRFSLQINKYAKDKVLSIYSLYHFTTWLEQKGTISQADSFAEYFDDYIVFFTHHPIENIGSKSIIFTSNPNFQKPQPDDSNKRSIELLSENSALFQLNKKLTPTDFHLITATDTNNPLRKIFDAIKLAYSLGYLANTTYINGNSVSYRFNGYKTFSTQLKPPSDYTEDIELTYKIYSWSYLDGKCGDKLGLTRNLITLCADQENLRIDQALWLAIQSNYEIYLKDNISHYLELKSSLSSSISDFSNKTLETTDNFIISYQLSSTGITTFIVTVAVVNGLKDNGTQEIFSPAYLLISALICIISAIWMAISHSDTKLRISNRIKDTKLIISKNYSTILNPAEIDDITQPIYNSIEEQAERRINKYFTLWALSITLFITIFSAGTAYQLLNPAQKENNEKSEQDRGDQKKKGAQDLNHPPLLKTSHSLPSI